MLSTIGAETAEHEPNFAPNTLSEMLGAEREVRAIATRCVPVVVPGRRFRRRRFRRGRSAGLHDGGVVRVDEAPGLVLLRRVRPLQPLQYSFRSLTISRRGRGEGGKRMRSKISVPTGAPGDHAASQAIAAAVEHATDGPPGTVCSMPLPRRGARRGGN